MIGALKDVPAERFRAHPDYLTPGSQWGHTLAANTATATTGKVRHVAPVPNYDNWNIGRYPTSPRGWVPR